MTLAAFTFTKLTKENNIMPPVTIILIGAAVVASYIYVGKPIGHAVKKASHATCHVVTLGKKCK